jgi:hypothetical protein
MPFLVQPRSNGKVLGWTPFLNYTVVCGKRYQKWWRFLYSSFPCFFKRFCAALSKVSLAQLANSVFPAATA